MKDDYSSLCEAEYPKARFENRCDLNRLRGRLYPQREISMTAKREISFWVVSFATRAALIALALLSTFGLPRPANATHATVFSREQDIPELRLGQRVRVDDGTCPAGQIKEVSGTKMVETGVQRARKCVPRGGPKLR
jgi:hypothetical protein